MDEILSPEFENGVKLEGIETTTTTNTALVVEEAGMSGDGPLQKKIIPWENLLDAGLDLSRDPKATIQTSRQSLIVVASLLSKTENLGGLCRTCEIFNAEVLVIPSAKIIQTPVFQSLSSTGDKWMPIVEVAVTGLETYLLEKKGQGYSLIGIEQATDSVSLEEFIFPPKSLLLIGNEGKGIPSNFLQLLDHIIEIPQLGVVRSLNAHVSGSLVVWEYTKQQMK